MFLFWHPTRWAKMYCESKLICGPDQNLLGAGFGPRALSLTRAVSSSLNTFMVCTRKPVNEFSVFSFHHRCENND